MLFAVCFLAASVPVFSKAVLRLLDIDLGQPRLPLSAIDDITLERLRNDLDNIAFFDWALASK